LNCHIKEYIENNSTSTQLITKFNRIPAAIWF
jgi:hypothetical protein